MPVYLSQVADVIDGEKEHDELARINGQPAITLDIQKAQDANIVETGRNVQGGRRGAEGAPAVRTSSCA